MYVDVYARAQAHESNMNMNKYVHIVVSSILDCPIPNVHAGKPLFFISIEYRSHPRLNHFIISTCRFFFPYIIRVLP